MNIKYTAIICVCLGLLMTPINGMSPEQQQKLDKQLIDTIGYDNLNEVKNLIRKGANVNARDRWGIPFLLRALPRHQEIAKYLITNGADVNTKTSDDNTVLMRAAHYGLFDLVKFLVQNGADINIVNDNNDTALSIAQGRGHNNIVDFLKDPQQYYRSRQLVIIKDTKAGTKPGAPDIHFNFVNNLEK